MSTSSTSSSSGVTFNYYHDDITSEEWTSFIDQLLPDTPDSTKFTKVDFIGKTFNVDSFIERRKHEPLGVLREQLSAYHQRLLAATRNIITEDYTDFVHLANQITGVGKSMDKIYEPLSESRDRIVSVRDELKEKTDSLEVKRKHLRNISRTKKDLERAIKLYDHLSRLDEEIKQVKEEVPSSSREVRMMKISHDLLEGERMSQLISQSNPLVNQLRQQFSHLSVEVSKLQHNLR